MSSQAHLVRVGLFVVTAIFTLVALLVWLGYYTISSAKGPSVNVLFSSVKGLKPGADVRLNGVNIGVVEDVEADAESGGAVVTVRLDKGQAVNRRSVYRVTVGSLLGEATMDIFSCQNPHDPDVEPRDPLPECHPSIEDRILQDGELAPGIFRAARNLDDVVEDFAAVIETLREQTVGGINQLLGKTEGILEDLGDKLGELVEEVRSLTGDLRETAGSVDVRVENILDRVASVVEDVKEMSSDLPDQVDEVVESASATLEEARAMIADLAEQADGLDLQTRMDDIQGQLDSILADFKRLSSELASDETIDGIRRTMDEVESAAANANEMAERIATIEQDGEVRLVAREDASADDNVLSEVRFGLRGPSWWTQFGAEWIGSDDTVTLLGGWRREGLRIGAGLRREAPTAEIRWGTGVWVEGQAWWPESLEDVGYKVGVGAPLFAGTDVYVGYEDDVMPGTEETWLFGFRYGF